MTTATTTQEPEAMTPEQPEQLNMGESLGGNLCLLKMTVKAPDGLVMIKDYKLETSQGDGEYVPVEKGKVTNPRFRIDTHPLWRKLTENKYAIFAMRNRYTVSDAIEGQYLLNMKQAGPFLAEFTKLRDERLSLARLMQDLWHTEVVPSIREAIGEQNFHLHVKPKLPNPETLPSRFGVDYALYPLTPVKGEDLSFEALDADQAQKLASEVSEKAQQAVMDRFQAVADCVLGETLELCEEISQGSLETGKKRGSSLQKILDVLERVRHFKEWATPEVLQHVDHAYKVVSRTNAHDLNRSEELQQAVKAAFRPLGQTVQKVHKQKPRVKRKLMT